MPSVLTMISDKDRLDFSQNYSIQRNYVGDILFPDVKTDNLEAEYERLSEGMELPTAAKVHAFDTEAAIGVRPSFEKVFSSLRSRWIREYSTECGMYLRCKSHQHIDGCLGVAQHES